MPFLTDPTYRRKTSGKWEVIYYDMTPPTKRRRFKGGFRTRAAAARWFAALQMADEAPASITFGEYAKTYMASRASSVRATTRALDATTIRRFTKHVGADTPLAAITPAHLETYLATIPARSTKGHACAHTLNGELRRLRTALNTAIRWGHLRSNPAAGVAMRRTIEAAIVHLTPEEQARLVAASRQPDMAPYLYPLVVLALRTGLRLGELLTLRWCDVDVPRRQLTVRTTDGAVTKTGKARVVGLDGDALVAIAWWREWFDREREAAHDKAADPEVEYHARRSAEFRAAWLEQCSPAPKHPVFPSFTVAQHTARVEPMQRVKKAWARLVRLAFGTRRVRFHDLRHTFAVQCARAGIPLPLLSQLLGHSTVTMTQRYLRFYPDAGAAMLLNAVPPLGNCGHFVASETPEISANPQSSNANH